MEKIELLVPNEGRKVKNMIMALLKKGLVSDVLVVNYAKIYTLVEKKLIKTERKLISLNIHSQKVEELLVFIEQVSGWKRETGDLIVK